MAVWFGGLGGSSLCTVYMELKECICPGKMTGMYVYVIAVFKLKVHVFLLSEKFIHIYYVF